MISNLREEAREFLKFEAGDGRNIRLWFDWCHPDGVLYGKYDHRVVYDAQSKIEAIYMLFSKNKIGIGG